jgi:small-conductance mechanosensitive channel
MPDLLNNVYILKAVQSLALALVVFVLTKITQMAATNHHKHSPEISYAIKYSAIFIFAIATLFIWLEGFERVLTALTLVAAALTIVAKEVILNFLGSFVIFWRELFAIGDRVQVGDHSGDVIDKGILFFTLLETGRKDSTGHSTGRLVKIPNAQVLTLAVINATRGAGYVWNELCLTLSRESDWEKARQLLLDGSEEYRKRESIDLERVKQSFERKKVFFKKLDPIVYVSIATGGINLTLRYLCRSRMIRESEDFICTRFLNSLEPGSLELAVEQTPYNHSS